MSLDRIVVVLSHPSHPGNVGAAARAMKTMGLTELRLVAAPEISLEAEALAAGGITVLENARRYKTLEKAIADCALAVAFTARPRGLSRDAAPIRSLAPFIAESAKAAPVALVFGNETSGLSNEEVGHCQRIATIPANEAYSSLNLAAAVQVACYEVAVVAGSNAPAKREPFEAATGEDLEALFAHFERSMVASGYLDPKKPGRLMERLRRLFARTRLERSEVRVLRGMLEAFERKMRP
jgi:tRNA/rRNA methyltransferase